MAAGFVIDDTVLNQYQNLFRSWLATEDDWTMHLFTADHTPADGDDETDYTEATFDGYEVATLTAGEWDAIVLADHVASLEYTPAPEFTYEVTGVGSVTVYGYYLLDGDGDFKIAERLPTPVVLSPGNAVRITPRVPMKNCRDE